MLYARAVDSYGSCIAAARRRQAAAGKRGTCTRALASSKQAVGIPSASGAAVAAATTTTSLAAGQFHCLAKGQVAFAVAFVLVARAGRASLVEYDGPGTVDSIRWRRQST